MMKVYVLKAIGSIFLSTLWVAEGQSAESDPIYRVRSAAKNRDLQTVIFNPLDMMLSFSDDGPDKEDEFYLDMFDTPSILTDSGSPMVISNAMNNFLLAELNDRFDKFNTVEKVSSEIVNFNQRNGTYIDSFGEETLRVGTEARIRVILSFDQSPSPKTEDVLELVKEVMSNLTYFVTNLTSSVSEDNELNGVYVAIRREIRPPVLVEPPDQTIVVDISGGTGRKKDNVFDSPTEVITTAVPIVLAVAVLVAAVVFFVFKKRDRPAEPESSKSSEMMYDVENEIFSMDRSVASVETKSPVSKPIPISNEASSIQYSISNDSGAMTDTPGGDSVFSGIETEYGGLLSPKSLSSPKSMLTGFTCGSASTILASNLQDNKSNKNNKKSTKPKSPVSNSIFSFLDPIEDTDEEDIDHLELIERAQKSTASQNCNEKTNSENATGSTDGSESSSSSSLQGISIHHPAKSKKEERTIGATEVTSSDPVSHVLADLENMETAISSVPRDPTPSNMAHQAQTKNAAPTPRNSEEIEYESIDTKEKEEESPGKAAMSVATRASNLMSGFFKGRRKSESTPNSPISSPSNEEIQSAPSSPMQQVGRHWLASADQKPLRIPMSPKLERNIDYDRMLSHASPTEDDYNHSTEFNDTINDSMQIVDRAPEDAPEFDPSGGRRHAGDKIGGDGSALYQASAMKPTDWSYKSSDVGSVGSSTIDDEMSPRKSNNKNIEVLASDSKKSVSASRQLINDLVWLEKKIATVRGETTPRGAPALGVPDSLSFDSKDNLDGIGTNASHSRRDDRDASNIVCRDCIAPPGKLHIVIHSTKDGPAVHTVKDGSNLQGEMFSGDLIISVDDVDTRTCKAEEVMKMMASKGDRERKITVLRFLEEV